MSIALLILNIFIFLSTFLGLSMFNHQLKKISQSIDIYMDPKAYKPESKVRFIASLVDMYKSYENKSSLDLDLLIQDCFYNNKIGKFKVSSIETLATKGKRVLGVSIITMVLFEAMTVGLGQSIIRSIGIIISTMLNIGLVFCEMYMDIESGKSRLFLKIKNYLNNEYPQLKTKEKEKKEVAILMNKINQLEAQIKKQEEISGQQKDKVELQEEDIAQILQHFNLWKI